MSNPLSDDVCTGGGFLLHLEFIKPWILSLWTDPLWMIALTLPIMYTVYTNLLERKYFGHIVEAPIPAILRTFAYGIAIGLVMSLALSAVTFSIDRTELLLIWTVTGFFALFRRRFTCIAYAVGSLSLLHLALPYMEPTMIPSGMDSIMDRISHFSVLPWLLIVAITHLIEWMFIRLEGSVSHTPVQLDHISGHRVPGYLLAKTWPIAFIALTPNGWLPLPIVIGFASKTCSKPLKQKKRLVSTFTLFYALCLFILIFVAMYVPQQEWLWLAAAFALVGHEVLYLGSDFLERRRTPLFVSNEKGLRVLAVLPQTPAALLGIKTGDIIYRLNGMRIKTPDDLEKAVALSSFCKLEVIDEQQDSHYLQRAIYEKDPKHLGIVASPVEWRVESG
jgi:hypothetical protein